MRGRNWRRLTIALWLAVIGAAGVLAAADDHSPEVYLQLGDLLLQESRYGEAADAYARAKAADDPGLAGRALSGLTRALLRTARFSRARSEAEALVALQPGSADAVSLHGETLWSVGLFPESEARFREALTLDAVHARAHHGLARTLTSRRQFAEALDHVRQALSVRPDDYEFHHTEGFIFDRLGRYAEAAEALRRYQTRCWCGPRSAFSSRSAGGPPSRWIRRSPPRRTPCRSASCVTRSWSRAASMAAGRSSWCSTPAPR
jgi:Flp pilus assembly protein TadD